MLPDVVNECPMPTERATLEGQGPAQSPGQTNVTGNARVHQGNIYNYQATQWDHNILHFHEVVSQLNGCTQRLFRQGVNNGTAHMVEGVIASLLYAMDNMLGDMSPDLRNAKKLEAAYEATRVAEEESRKSQEEKDTAQATVRITQERLTAATDEVSRLKAEVKALSELPVGRLNAKLAQKETHIQTLEQRFERLKEQNFREREKLDATRKNMMSLEERFHQSAEAERRNMDHRLNAMRDDFQKQTTSLRDLHNHDREAIEYEANTRLKELRTAYEKELHTRSERHEAELSRLKAAMRRERDEHIAEIQEIIKDHDKQLKFAVEQAVRTTLPANSESSMLDRGQSSSSSPGPTLVSVERQSRGETPGSKAGVSSSTQDPGDKQNHQDTDLNSHAPASPSSVSSTKALTTAASLQQSTSSTGRQLAASPRVKTKVQRLFEELLKDPNR